MLLDAENKRLKATKGSKEMVRLNEALQKRCQKWKEKAEQWESKYCEQEKEQKNLQKNYAEALNEIELKKKESDIHVKDLVLCQYRHSKVAK